MDKNKSYTDVRRMIRFNEKLLNAKVSSGVIGSEFAKTELKVGKRQKELGVLSKEQLENNLVNAQNDSMELNAYKNRIDKIVAEAKQILENLDSVKKWKPPKEINDAISKMEQDRQFNLPRIIYLIYLPCPLILRVMK